jgi:rare lipoprotein A (peptidoglycan hydrolase)
MKMQRLFFLFILSLVILFVSFGYQTTVQADDSIPAKEKTSEAEQVTISSLDKEPESTLAIARYYAKRHNGRRTSCGAIYNPHYHY